jgi:hypothetical protein
VTEFATMVNGEFRDPQSYGFGMVHAQFAELNRRIGHQWKIYGEFN